MDRLRMASIAASGALVLAGCVGVGSAVEVPDRTLAPSTTVPPPGSTDGTLRIGLLTPMTGPQASLGPPIARAVDLAVTDINAAGGVNGRPVEMVVADEGPDAATALVAADRLVRVDRVDAVIGPVSSAIALRVLGTLVSGRVLTCSPATTAMALTDFPDEGLFFRTAPSDELEGAALGSVIAATGARSTAILYPDDDYGRSLAGVLAARLAAEGTEVVASTPYDPTGQAVLGPVQAALETRPRSVAVIGVTGGGGAVLSALAERGRGPDRLPTFVNAGLRSPMLWPEVAPSNPAVLSGITGTSPAVLPVDEAFVQRWETEVPELMPTYAAHAYDCATTIALAAVASGTDDGTRMAVEVAPLTGGGAVCRTFASCRDLLQQGRNIDLDGASGSLELDARGDPRRAHFDVFTFDAEGLDVTVRQVEMTG